ncbi:protein FAM81A-like [Physella acuta]|uniref:protein FAM81A-like n=1 Tax=Physella acuta TaxID=109671 RepID=UPI0027DE5565|nr:protein FAM81A-like [Physella acuta]XP_059176276.1 protein FAM81A-like [Physella acuta]
MALRRTNLPVINRAPYDTTHEYNAISVGSPRQLVPEQRQIAEIVPVRNDLPSRIDNIEDRLAMQERNTQALIDKAFKIKEDVIDSLNYTQGTWNEEKQARVLLQEHIRTITAVVNKLNGDIASLESSIKARDAAHVSTNNAVKNLEVHHVQSLTDLRGRIVRCDSSISKLSADVRSCFESIKQLSHQQQEIQSRMMDRMHGLEAQLVTLNSNIERSNGESRLKIQHLEGDTNTQMSMIDAKTRQLIEDLKANLASTQSTFEAERERLEQRLLVTIEKVEGNNDLTIDKIMKKIDDGNFLTDSRITKLEETLHESRSYTDNSQSSLDSKLLSKLDKTVQRHSEEIAKLKKESREGFSTVHESISNMKTVMEGKRKLLEDQLRKEIGQIRKMVVLV